MKKIITFILTSVVLLVLMSRCYYDEVIVFKELPKNVSLKNDVMPIFQANCTASGCHDAKASHSPSLVADNAYTALTTGQYVNVVEPQKSKLYQELLAGMPPSGPLTSNETKLILAWITEGAKNN